MCMRTVDVVINMYTLLSQLIDMKGKLMHHFHLYEDIVNYTLCSMRFIYATWDRSSLLGHTTLVNVADDVINIVYYDISRNVRFNTNSQVTGVSYMYCYITISLNLMSKVITYE